MYDNPTKIQDEEDEEKSEREEEVKDSGEKEFLEAYIHSLKDRGDKHQRHFNITVSGRHASTNGANVNLTLILLCK